MGTPKESAVQEAARAAGITTEQARRVVDVFLAVLRDEVWRLGRFCVQGFGSFRIRRKKAHRVLSPSGVLLQVPEHDAVTFKASATWRFR